MARNPLILLDGSLSSQLVQKVQFVDHRSKLIARIANAVLGSGFSENVYDRAMQFGLRLAGAYQAWDMQGSTRKELGRKIRSWQDIPSMCFPSLL